MRPYSYESKFGTDKLNFYHTITLRSVVFRTSTDMEWDDFFVVASLALILFHKIAEKDSSYVDRENCESCFKIARIYRREYSISSKSTLSSSDDKVDARVLRLLDYNVAYVTPIDYLLQYTKAGDKPKDVMKKTFMMCIFLQMTPLSCQFDTVDIAKFCIAYQEEEREIGSSSQYKDIQGRLSALWRSIVNEIRQMGTQKLNKEIYPPKLVDAVLPKV